MRVVILTGLSARARPARCTAWRTWAISVWDNLPTQLLDPFIELCTRSRHSIQLAAIAVDVRGGTVL